MPIDVRSKLSLTCYFSAQNTGVFRPALQSSRTQWHKAARLAVAGFILALLRGVPTSKADHNKNEDGIVRLLSRALIAEEAEDMVRNDVSM